MVHALGLAPDRQGALGEDDIGVVRGISIAQAIAHEDHRSTGTLMTPHPLALACAAHQAGRMAEREGHAGTTHPEDGRIRGHRQVREAEAGEHALDMEADPIADDLDGSAGASHEAHEAMQCLIEGDGVDLSQQ
jgi:hypothetical protein